MTTQQQLPSGTYGVDRVHSTIGFGVKHLGLSSFRSSFADWDASYVDGTLTGTVQVASIAIEEPNLKGHVLSADFFDAEALPTITFASTDIRVAADGSVEVDGDLTIRGVTKPVTAIGEFSEGEDPGGNQRVAFEIEAKIDRRDYDLSWQNALPNGKDAVAWDVVLQAHLELVKA